MLSEKVFPPNWPFVFLFKKEQRIFLVIGHQVGVLTAWHSLFFIPLMVILSPPKFIISIVYINVMFHRNFVWTNQTIYKKNWRSVIWKLRLESSTIESNWKKSTTMGNVFAKLFTGLFGKREMRILMVCWQMISAAVWITSCYVNLWCGPAPSNKELVFFYEASVSWLQLHSQWRFSLPLFACSSLH